MTETPTWSNPPQSSGVPQGPGVPQNPEVPPRGPASSGQRGTLVPGQPGSFQTGQPGSPTGAAGPGQAPSGGPTPTRQPPEVADLAATSLGPVRVNLLPEPYQHRLSILGAQRRAKIAIGCTAVVVLLVSALSFIQAGLSSADLSGAKNDQISAQQAVNRYAEVPRLSSQLNEIKAGLTDALAAEVLFSEMIKSVGTTLPSGVSLSSLTFSLAATSSGTSGAGAATGGSASGPEIGLLSITGTAPSLESISTFIENLEASEEFDTVTLTSATRSSSSSGSGTYAFSGTANMGQGALSGRYAKDGIKSQ